MLVNADTNPDIIACLLERIQQELPDLEVDFILDVGSRAKGEATPLSDFDFQVTVRDAGRIISDRQDTNSDLLAVLPHRIDSKVASIYGVPLREIEYDCVERISGKLEQKFNQKVGLVFVDTRTSLLNLAFETPFSAFRTHWFTLTSKLVFDRGGKQPELQYHIIREKCFHWEQTIDLQVWRFTNHKKLDAILRLGAQPLPGQDGDGAEAVWLSWTKWALNYLRFAIGTWSLALYGYYAYRREEVLRFVAARLPQSCLEFALQLYRQKRDLQLGIHALRPGRPRAQLLGALAESQTELDALLNLIRSNLETIRPKLENRRYKENCRSLLERATEWFPIPQLNIQEWSEAALASGRAILLS
jgi:predicted nucleotidyltransferase